MRFYSMLHTKYGCLALTILIIQWTFMYIFIHIMYIVYATDMADTMRYTISST